MSREEVVERIHDYLSKLAAGIREGGYSTDKFTIFKSLTKNPEDYADKNAQPHVQVALRLKEKGEKVQIGNTVPYVICAGNDNLIAQRAHHPDELKKMDNDLVIGIRYFLID